MTHQLELIEEIEQVSLRAYPALEEEDLDGWLLRFANGFARRTNSVQPFAHRGDVQEKMSAVAGWYDERHTAVTYRMTPASQPPELDALLESNGYFYQDPTSVQVLDIRTQTFERDASVEFYDEPVPEWFDSIMESSRYMSGRRPTLERTLRMIEPAAAFVVVRDGMRPIATGMAVADGRLVGLYSISTRPEHRKRGVGRTISETLLGWGREQGATMAYLQVMHVNDPAANLYSSMGFEHVYDYWYRCPVEREPMKG